MITALPGPFKAAVDQISAAIANGDMGLDVAVQFTKCVVHGCWGHLNKLLDIAGL